jgi:hypothetical protein
MQDDDRMNDNVVKFRKPAPPKKPRQPMGPKAKKALTIVAVVAFFVAAWGYFTLMGQG